MLDLQRKLKIGKSILTVEEFKEKYASELDDVTVEETLNVLESKGNIVWMDQIDPAVQQVEKILNKSEKEISIVNAANQADEFDQQAKEFKLDKKRANQLKHKGYYWMFGNIQQARIFEEYVANNLGLQTEISFVLGQPKLTVYNITDKEIGELDRKYKLESGIQTAVNVVDKTATTATKAVDYTAQKVIAPVVQVGAKAGVSILGTVAKTGAKSLGTIISAIATGSKQCVKEIKHDDDVLRAGRELINVKDEIKHAVVNKTSTHSGNGGYID